jgi:hypothetical protein
LPDSPTGRTTENPPIHPEIAPILTRYPFIHKHSVLFVWERVVKSHLTHPAGRTGEAVSPFCPGIVPTRPINPFVHKNSLLFVWERVIDDCLIVLERAVGWCAEKLYGAEGEEHPFDDF